MNAEALGLGLKDVAFTFSLNDAEVAEVGEAGDKSSITPFFGVALAEATAGDARDVVPLLNPDGVPSGERFPLNGGIAWITMRFWAGATDVGADAWEGVEAGPVAAAAAAAFIASFAAAGLAAATGP